MPVQIKPAISMRSVLVNMDFVIPAEAGIHHPISPGFPWIPAFAGMTYDLIQTD